MKTIKVFTSKNKLQLHLTIFIFSVFLILLSHDKPFEKLTFENIHRVGFFISSEIEASLKKNPLPSGLSLHSIVHHSLGRHTLLRRHYCNWTPKCNYTVKRQVIKVGAKVLVWGRLKIFAQKNYFYSEHLVFTSYSLWYRVHISKYNEQK